MNAIVPVSPRSLIANQVTLRRRAVLPGTGFEQILDLAALESRTKSSPDFIDVEWEQSPHKRHWRGMDPWELYQAMSEILQGRAIPLLNYYT